MSRHERYQRGQELLLGNLKQVDLAFWEAVEKGCASPVVILVDVRDKRTRSLCAAWLGPATADAMLAPARRGAPPPLCARAIPADEARQLFVDDSGPKIKQALDHPLLAGQYWCVVMAPGASGCYIVNNEGPVVLGPGPAPALPKPLAPP